MFLNREIEVHEIPVSVEFELDNATTFNGAWGSFELSWCPLMLSQCLACFEVAWIVLQNSTCKASKQKWQCVLMELQQLVNGLDSSGILLRMCLKWFWIKRTRGFEGGLWFAELALFCKKMWFLSIRVLWGWKARASGLQGYAKLVWKLCFSSIYQMCVLWDFGHLTCFESKDVKWPSYGLYRLVTSMLKLVYYAWD